MYGITYINILYLINIRFRTYSYKKIKKPVWTKFSKNLRYSSTVLIPYRLIDSWPRVGMIHSLGKPPYLVKNLV